VRDDRFPDLPDGRPGSPANGHPAGDAPRNGASRHDAGRPTAVTGVLSDDDDTVGDAPIDLVAVQADDELVTTIGARSAGPLARHLPGPFPGGRDIGRDITGRDPGGSARDDRLVAMLAAWRAEIDAEPIPELVDLDAAVAAVVAGVQAQESTARRRRSGRLRHLAPLAAAAAIIVATVTGVGLGSQDAVPGDTLWPIQKVVNPERAESVEAKVEVESRLEEVRAALQTGDTATAAQLLEAIRTQIPAVRGEEGQPQLEQEQKFLAAKLADTPPNTPADLSTPPKSNPAALPTGMPPPRPPVPGVPPLDPAVTAPSASQSVTDPQSTEPDVRSGPVDQGSGPAAPVEPGKDLVLPKPSPPAADVTSAPEAPKPEPHPEPPGAGNPGGTEGGVDPSIDPGPVEQPPPSGANDGTGASEGAGTSSDTTTASGSASVATTATDTTS
jgi:hypothetical protein